MRNCTNAVSRVALVRINAVIRPVPAAHMAWVTWCVCQAWPGAPSKCDRRACTEAHGSAKDYYRGCRQALEAGVMIEGIKVAGGRKRLVLGWFRGSPLHVVTLDALDGSETAVITVYDPERESWATGFKRRKR